MIKQLQDKLLRLQTQKNNQQSEYIKKKQHYQSIIQQLQNQNQKLRKVLEDNESLSMIESQAKSHKSSKISSPVHEYNKERQIPDDEKQNPLAQSQLLEQNQTLKVQLAQLTKTYEQQIQQMNSYFNKIQETYIAYTQKANYAPKEQINDLVRAYQNLLKDFESQRMKYVQKIEELTNYIMKCEEREKAIEESNEKLEIELKIVREQLKIYKRSKIVK